MPYNKFYIGSELVNDIIQPGIVKEGILYNIDVNLNTISTSSLTASYPGIEIPAEPTQSWGSFAFDNVEFSNGSRAYYYTSSIEIPTTFVLNSASMYRADSDQFEFTWTFWINPDELGYNGACSDLIVVGPQALSNYIFVTRPSGAADYGFGIEGESGQHVLLISGSEIPTGSWSSLTTTMRHPDGLNTPYYFDTYLNGEPKHSITASGWDVTDLAVDYKAYQLGSRKGGLTDPTVARYNGYIGQILMYTGSLSDDQVRMNYNATRFKWDNATI